MMKSLIIYILTILSFLFCNIQMYAANIVVGNKSQYEQLWKDVDKKVNDDLPRDAIKLIKKISKKAETEKSYGNLLASMFYEGYIMKNIAPDSMEQYVNRWEAELAKLENKKADKVLVAMFHASLANVYHMGYENMPDSSELISQKHLDKALADFSLLHNVKTDDYLPLAYNTSRWNEQDINRSGNTLLDVIGHHFYRHELLTEYYDSIGDLNAACREKVFIYRKADFNKHSECEKLKADIEKYQHTEECALLTDIYYNNVILKDYKNDSHSSAKNKEIYDFLNNAVNKWKDSKYVDILKNAMSNFMTPAYHVSLSQETPLLVGKPVKFYVNNIKNLPSLRYRLTQLNVDENTSEEALRLSSNINKLKKNVPVLDITKKYSVINPWEESNDSIIFNSLKPGVYVLETNDEENTKGLCAVKVIRITDIAVITRTLSNDTVQFISVSASTGKILPNVSINLKYRTSPETTKTITLTTNSDGKAIFVLPSTKSYSKNISFYAYTPNDKGFERKNIWTEFSVSKYVNTTDNAFVFTDRKIYRPGQLVKATITVYNTADENNSYVCENKKIKINVQDAIGENICESNGITNSFGSVSFEIPIQKDKRNGQYSIEVIEEDKSGESSIGYYSFNVEEYKRPTFEISIDEYTKEICAFDTTKIADNGGFKVFDVEGTVLTTNKMPVRNNKVEYKITRRKPWYYRYLRSTKDEYLVEGETITNQDGRFAIPVTLTLEEGSKGYYIFEVAVKVTNANGETQESSTVIRAYATKEDDTPNDKEETPVIPIEHFKATADAFGPNGEPVCIELGSSLTDITVYYYYISETGIKKDGTLHFSNEIIKVPLSYEKAYGDALYVNYTWIKNGISHSFSHTIKKPVRDHQLHYHWVSMRDMTTPGAKESWLLKVDNNEGRAIQLDATLYDKSLDQILEYNNIFTFSNNHCYIYNTNHIALINNYFNHTYKKNFKRLNELRLNSIGLNTKFFNSYFNRVFYSLDNVKIRGSKSMMSSANRTNTIGAFEAQEDAEAPMMSMKAMTESVAAEEVATAGVDLSSMVRKTLAETAYYTSLKSDINGNILLNINLPEDITTWQFRGFLHDNLMNYAFIDTTCVVRKAVMIKPNIPRYIRKGDKCYVSSVITNCIEEDINAKVVLQIYDGEHGKLLHEQSTNVCLKKDDDTNVSFLIDSSFGKISSDSIMLRLAVISDKGEDGEQHIIDVLPSYEEVITSLPFTIHGKGSFKHNISDLLIEGSTNRKARLEYISNAAWTMIEELPKLQIPAHNDAVSLASAIYASILSRSIIEELDIKDTTFINNSCWNADSLNAKIDALKAKLIVLQNSDGSWSWWKGMDGSVYMSACVARILSRLSYMVNVDTPINAMIARTMEYLEKKVSKEVVELKKLEKKKVKVLVPSESAVEYLYCTTLLGNNYVPSTHTLNDIKYLLKLLEKDPKIYTIYGKVHSAAIMSYYKKTKTAENLVESTLQYSVFSDEAGRYFDTPKAYYSWRNYKIPTQVAAIETLLRLKPNEKQTIEELQRWLLHEKRTQKWDCTLNTVDAVCAFLATGKQSETKYFKNIALDTLITSIPKDVHEEIINIEEKRNVEVTHDNENTTLWGAVYVSQVAPLENIKSTESGFKIKREILNAKKSYSVGDKVTIRLTIDADRDYDFVEINDGKASCLEPLNNISGYSYGYYMEIKDDAVNYYFDKFRKGRHIVENEYYIDHRGEFMSSPCNIKCAYAPEFRGNTSIMKINVE